MSEFRIQSDFEPTGHQPAAIDALTEGLRSGARDQTLLGVTGSGKTFTMACIVERVQRPALIMAPNKTLAAQLFTEFRELFPGNAVEYFVSYYDYYQPEAYLPNTDVYIEKDSSINERIDRMRHSATRNVLSRRDVIVVASVSCIYGLGSPDAYLDMRVELDRGAIMERDELLRQLTAIQYRRRDFDLGRGTFRVRGDVIDLFPIYEDDSCIRFELFGDEIETIQEIDPLTGEIRQELDTVKIYPATHYVTPEERLERAMTGIEEELDARLSVLRKNGKLVEAYRLEQRTRYDLEMMKEIGFCSGIENYSRWLDGRQEGEPPSTLLDYFPTDMLLFMDESHVTVPQVGGMYKGDRSRKETLVEYGFRLPSALDNRPLRFDEFAARKKQAIYVSATPADYELEHSGRRVVEQIIRPTGLTDPPIEVRPVANQIDDLLGEIRTVAGKGQRVLVTTLTKRMAEDLTDYLSDAGVRVRYLHADIDTIERHEIIRDLRLGEFDVLVGINLLREGLDLPEVSLVAILDADKEGFLRAERSLIQTCGRAARNVDGRVIMYAAKHTDSMKRALAEMDRRRQAQIQWNEENGITPESVKSRIHEHLSSIYERDYVEIAADAAGRGESVPDVDLDDIPKRIESLRQAMFTAAKELDFEEAARLRDELFKLEKHELTVRGVKIAPAVEKKLRSLPKDPGVYLFLGKAQRVLYVGKATELRSRVRSYFSGGGPEDRPRIVSLLGEVRDLEVIRTANEKEALLLENSLIKKHKPKGNVRLRDDKNYLCVRIDRRHPFPRITFVRKFERDGAIYFGPFSSAKSVRETVRVIQAAYGLRVCSDSVLANRSRPCMYYEIGRCTAPCVDLVTREDYATSVEKALDVLRGNVKAVVQNLTAKMERHSGALEFERAADFRDRIAAVTKTAERQSVSRSDLAARDVVHVSRRGDDLLFVVLFVREGKLLSSRHHFIRSDADYDEAMASFLVQFYAEGKALPPEILVSDAPEGNELLEGWLTEERGARVRLRVPQRGSLRSLIRLAAENADALAKRDEASKRDHSRFALDALAEALDLPGPPTRIECTDISTIQGAATVASLVTFDEGMPDKSSYRRYRIRTVAGQDDFASMREVLTRRFRRKDEMPLPDLLIVDGGKGQLSSALEALDALEVVDLPVVGLAKARAGQVAEKAMERVFLPGRGEPVVLAPDAPETLLIARIRDEAHRFAIRYHRKVRSELAMSSVLDRIDGVGEVWRKRLLRKFGSVEGIRAASLDELLLVPGLPRETARRIHEFLQAEGGTDAKG